MAVTVNVIYDITPAAGETDGLMVIHSNNSFTFKNDTGNDLPAGTVIEFGDTYRITAFTARDVKNGAIGEAHLMVPKPVLQGPLKVGTAVAVGDVLSQSTSDGLLYKNTTGIGRYLALPKNAGGLSGASAAATTADLAVLVVSLF